MSKKIGFTIKRPRKRSVHGFGLRICNTRWIDYEEPLQTSCLGNNQDKSGKQSRHIKKQLRDINKHEENERHNIGEI